MQSNGHGGSRTPIAEDAIIALCERIASGRVLRDVCNDDDMPSRPFVYAQMAQNPAIKDMITRARQEAAHGLAEQVVTIADEATPETVQVARQRCESRRWLAGRWNAAYADKPTEVNVSLSWERLIEQSLKTVEAPLIEHDSSPKRDTTGTSER